LKLRLPNEDLRQLVHLLCGGGAFLLFYWPAWAVIALLWTGFVFSTAVRMYEARRGSASFPLFRSCESYWRNGALTYALGLTICILLFGREPGFYGWIVLAVGDSFATTVGRHLPLWRWPYLGKSLGGTVAFVVFSTPALTLAQYWVWTPEQYEFLPFIAIFTSAFITVPAAVVELLSRWIDDNLSVSLVASLAAWFII